MIMSNKKCNSIKESDHQFKLDIKSYLSSVFNNALIKNKFTHVITVGCNDVAFLKSLFEVVCGLPGQNVKRKSNSVQLICVTDAQSHIEESSIDISTICHKLYLENQCNVDCIKSISLSLGIADSNAIFVMVSFPMQQHKQLFDSDYINGEFVRKNGFIVIDDGNNTDKLLIAASEKGLFSRSNTSKVFNCTSTAKSLSLNFFEKRLYSIRHPYPEDFDALLEMDRACWNKARRSTPKDLKGRVVNNPAGQCVLEIDGNIVGSIYSQRINTVEILKGLVAAEVSAHHVDDAPIAQLIAVNVQPDMQHLGFGDQLLEFMLQYCTRTNSIEQVVAVSLCKNYPDHTSMPMDRYIHTRGEDGFLLDPILRFHDCHGAVISRLVQGYRPEDYDNEGNGVLVEYDLHKRRIIDATIDDITLCNEANVNEDISTDDIPRVVEEHLHLILGEARISGFSVDRSLMDMGFDSLDLMTFRTRISVELGFEIDPAFFFRYGNPAAIIVALQQIHNKSGDTTSALHETRNEWRRPTDTDDTQGDSEPISFSEGIKEKIAIIGIGCRFPGGVNSADSFWAMLKNGQDGVEEIPLSRWNGCGNEEALLDLLATQSGGTISDIDQFDANFFGISPREANLLDPQQRLLLEVSYQAFEHAGIASAGLKEQEVGVFMGMFSHDYELLQIKQNQERDFEPYYATGNANSVAAGRLSYVFGFQGPAITVDTACSSSLVAIHLACQSLRQKECAVAVAGGVNLMLSPELSLSFSKAGMLSPEGRCKTFDASADGYVRSEGCGVVILKPLSQALLDNDNVIAVIRGSAVNQDGASNGLTAPNQLAQEAVIKSALASSDVKADDISYVEAHGTGTPLGDPVEVGALQNVYGNRRSSENALLIGSAKTNIGHTEAAAGVAGLIKVALSLQNKFLPKHLHFSEANPLLNLESIPIDIPTSGNEWKLLSGSSSRCAGISSFGFSGTNSHLIMEQAPDAVNKRENSRPCYLLPISAKTKTACQKQVAEYADLLRSDNAASLDDVCYTAATGRNHYMERVCLLVSDTDDAVSKVSSVLEENIASDTVLATDSIVQKSKIAFMFTGQGSQMVGMGRELYQLNKTFRQALDQCENILNAYLEKPLLDILFDGNNKISLLHQTAYTQPALFSFEYALARLWISWGVKPDVLMGHSVGEYVAACIAGVMSLEDACRLIAGRGRLMQSLPAGGKMAAIFDTKDNVSEMISTYGPDVSIAAINGPANTVISGKESIVKKICADYKIKDIQCVQLQVSHAFHSSLMEPMLEEFKQIAESIQFNVPEISIISNLTGSQVDTEIQSSDYWVQHIRQAVQFSSSMSTLEDMKIDICLEIGPQATLISMGKRCIPEAGISWIPSLTSTSKDWESLLNGAASLYLQGNTLDWKALYAGDDFSKTDVPGYCFERKRYWLPESSPKSFNLTSNKIHPLLGAPVLSALKEIQYETKISALSPAYLADHGVFKQAVFPAAAYVEMALAAGLDIDANKHWSVENINFKKALCLTEDASYLAQMILSPDVNDVDYDFKIFSLDQAVDNRVDYQSNQWQLNSLGRLIKRSDVNDQTSDISKILTRCTNKRDVNEFYKLLEARHYHYGSHFQSIREMWSSDSEIIGKIVYSKSCDTKANKHHFHPVVLDASFQLALSLQDADTYVPVSIAKIDLTGINDTDVWAHVERVSSSEDTELVVNIVISTLEGKVAARVDGLRFIITTKSEFLNTQNDVLENICYELSWRKQPLKKKKTSEKVTMLEPALVAQHLHDHVNLKHALYDFDLSSSILIQLESLTVNYITHAFQSLGMSFVTEERYTRNKLLKQLGISDNHSSQFFHLMGMLVTAGLLVAKEDGDEWVVAQAVILINPESQVSELLTRYPSAHPEIKFVQRCGVNLAYALQDKCDVLQLLFPQGALDEATTFYQNSLTFKGMNALIAESVKHLVEDVPVDQTIRILEIGAGTGGITNYILPYLRGKTVEYDFTDLSNLFLNKARDRFKEYDFVDYKLLNIEDSPEQQGYLSDHYDIIIAANVLHATQDIKQTIANVKQLLTAKGSLVLLEGTGQRNWVDLIFGLTEGWWRFTDTEIRSKHPLLTDKLWLDCFDDLGFESCTTVCPDKTGRDMLFKQSIVIAQTAKNNEMAKAQAEQWLVFSDEGGVADQLSERLIATGAVVTKVRAGDTYNQVGQSEFVINPDSVSDYESVLSAIQNNDSVKCNVLFFWALSLDDVDCALDTGVAGLAVASYASVLKLVQLLVNNESVFNSRLWLITQGARSSSIANQTVQATSAGIAQAPLWGMGKVITLEHAELKCTLVDIDPHADCTEALFDEINNASDEAEVMLHDGVRKVSRLLPYKNIRTYPLEETDQSVTLEIMQRGTLDHLKLCQYPRTKPASMEIEVRVHSCGLNFRDVLNTLGRYPGEPTPLGDECAGEVIRVGSAIKNFSPGDRVMTMAAGSFSQYVCVDSALAVNISKAMSYQSAATIPVVFLTVEYALNKLANIKHGDRVLIHAATGGVGQAAIQLAQQAGAEIFATASPAKWAVLEKMGVQHVLNSRTLEFSEQIKTLTQGKGVDIVLNSLADEFITESLSVLKEDGVFLEIGKAGIWTQQQVKEVKPLVNYQVIDMLDVRKNNAALINSMLSTLMKQFETEKLKSLPVTSFPLEKYTDAFRYMQQARHTGKIAINITCSPVIRDNASYLITGGMGGLGLLITDWLVEKGAKRIVLVGRSAGNEEAQLKIKELTDKGIDIVVETLDVSDSASLGNAIQKCAQHELPLAGVIHAVGVLDDGALLQQTSDRFQKVMAPKVEGAWNLHQFTKNIPIDFFVVFSSTASLVGTPGQANHAAANAFLDQLAYYRQQCGLPASVINWGAWSDIGAAARHNVGDFWAQRGISSINPSHGLQIFEELFNQSPIQVGVMPVDWQKYLAQFSFDSPQKFYEDFLESVAHESDIGASEKSLNYEPAVIKQEVLDGNTDTLLSYLHTQVLHVLRIDESVVLKQEQLLSELGLDSLTGIELRNKLNTELGVKLTLEQFFDGASLNKWCQIISEKITLNKLTDSAAITKIPLDEDFEEMTI